MEKEIDIMIKEYKELKLLCESKIENYNDELMIYECIISDLEKLQKVSKK